MNRSSSATLAPTVPALGPVAVRAAPGWLRNFGSFVVMGFSRTLFDAVIVVARNLTAIAAPGCDGHHEMVVSGSGRPAALTVPGRRLTYLTKW